MDCIRGHTRLTHVQYNRPWASSAPPAILVAPVVLEAPAVQAVQAVLKVVRIATAGVTRRVVALLLPKTITTRLLPLAARKAHLLPETTTGPLLPAALKVVRTATAVATRRAVAHLLPVTTTARLPRETTTGPLPPAALGVPALRTATAGATRAARAAARRALLSPEATITGALLLAC